MTTPLLAACAEIETLDRIEDVWSLLTRTFSDAGIPIILYLSSDQDMNEVRVLATHPQIHEGRSAKEDPFLHWCCVNYDLTKTGIEFMDDYDYLPEEAKAFIRKAADAGFRSGLAVPTRLSGSGRFGGFNLGTGLDRETFMAKIARHQDSLRFLCLVAHRRLEELGFDTLPQNETPEFRTRLLAPSSERLEGLSPREREVIYLLAQGLPRKEVARHCGISPHTVAEYTSKAYRKLGVRNRTEAARLVFDG